MTYYSKCVILFLGDYMNRIKELREKKNISMKAAAQQLNIPYTTYVNYEKGSREPTSEMLITLADFFNTSIDYLIGRDTLNSIENDMTIDSFEDEDIYRIERARKAMPEKERQKMMNILKASFDDYFSDDYIDEDTDE